VTAVATTTDDLGRLYRDSRLRIGDLIGDLDEDGLRTPVPACPGWEVSDVVAHLVAVAEDVLAGRLTRPPSSEETAAQVARFAGQPVGELLHTWEQVAPRFEDLISAAGVRPALFDVVAHEHDIRGALGRPGGRDDEVVRISAEMLLGSLAPSVAVRVRCDALEVRVGPGDGDELGLRTDYFDAFRWRLGRRSRAQLAAMEWSGDPSPVLDELVIFGPARDDVIE
jgi:uncharacterized protein (TIGR03083 family)